MERIRSRATVQRQIRVVELEGTAAELPAQILAECQAVGELTSVAEVDEKGLGLKRLGLGMVRNEPVARNVALTCGESAVKVLDADAVKEIREALRSDAGEQSAAQ